MATDVLAPQAADPSTALPLPPAPLTPPAHAASRRDLLGVSIGAALGGAMALFAASTSKTGRTAAAEPLEVPQDSDPGSLIYRLVERCTFGATPAELALANSLGFQAYVEYQLNHGAIPENPQLATMLATLNTHNFTNQQLFDPVQTPSSTLVNTQTIDATIFRAVWSTRQLYERMVEFWSDHFSIDSTVDGLAILKRLDDRALRVHALGNFGDLLRTSATSPAMLTYLDNDLSSNGFINENYARELIELHTVGADYFYAYPPADVQATIVAVSRCFTGWGWYRESFNDTSPGGTGTALRGTFYYNTTTSQNRVLINGSLVSGVTAGRHDTGSKTLGTLFGPAVIPAGRTGAAGQQDGLDVLTLLIAHPATATYIATKLCRRFLGEGVPQSVINKVRDAYLNPSNPTGVGDIKAMLRAMLTPANIAAAFPRLKRPFHLFVSAMRVLPTTITNTSSLRQQLSRAGHLPFAWNPPDGYPDTTEYWSGLVLPRWNFCASLLTNTSGNAGGVSGVTINDNALLGAAANASAVMAIIDNTIFAGGMPASDKAAIQATMNNLVPTPTQKRDALGLALSIPAFQFY
jgi:uncharacterized protein (DUF1800 family)